MQTERREGKRTTTSPNQHGPPTKGWKIPQSLLALTLETILRERLLVIIHPHCEVRICVGVGEPGPAQRREWRGREEKISATGQTRVDSQQNPLVDVRLRGEICLDHIRC